MGERDSIDSLPTSTLGQYRIRGRIGSGGMGDVFDAVHVTLDKRVAIKTLRRRYLDDEVVVARFLREGQLASRMRHPNIVDVTDVGVIDGLPCLVMEHLEGETLGQLIRRDGAMTPSALVDFLLPIIAAVDFAHDHGVLHRDLKPSNIFLARSWNGEIHPKVLDFGISKLVHESTEAALTTDSAFVGTPHYASPESVRAEKAADRRTDQYSMGVILYEGTTGVRPFAEKGGSFVTMAMAICNGDYRPPRAHNPELPEALERVILRAMALQADDRFLGMRQLGAALLPFASERARVIWAPSFGSADNESGRSPDTQVLRAASGMTSMMPGYAPASGQAPVPAPPPPGWPPSVPAYPLMHQSGSISGLPSSSHTPPPAVMGGYGQHFAPMGMHDRTPSFGAGINSSVHAPAPPAKGSSALVAIGVVALVGAGLIGVAVSRMSARHAATSEAATTSATFMIDVQTTPASAVFELDGAALGSGHLQKSFPRDGQKHLLRVAAPGYETLLVQFDETHLPPALLSLRASTQPSGGNGTTLAGGAPTGAGGAAKVTPTAPTSGSPGRPAPTSTTPPKGKPDRPRTDNIDPWE